MVGFLSQRIRDPVHNLISFGADQFENTLWRVIQTRPFQRLRRIKQLGFSDLVYPGATHSRFAHSVGVFHTARQLMGIIEKHLTERQFEPTRAHAALAAALVHDVGHGPFSHAFEEIGRRLNIRMANHEAVSELLIRDGDTADVLKDMGSGFANDVADIVAADRQNIYGAVVSSQFDADRLDYLRRDRLMTGTQLGAIDFEWLLDNIEIGEIPYGVDEKQVGKATTFVLGPKAVYAAETYVLGLFQLYPTVYLHKTTRGVEKVFGELLHRIFSLVMDGSVRMTGLTIKHPLVKFARSPELIDCVVALDDTVIWGALAQMSEAQDKIVRSLSERLHRRRLLKAIDVREIVKQQMGLEVEDESAAVDRACKSIDEMVRDWLPSRGIDSSPVLFDEAERKPYKEFQEGNDPLNQIMIRTASDGDLVDLSDRSGVVRAIKPFRLYRIYASEDDTGAHKFIKEIITAGVSNG